MVRYGLQVGLTAVPFTVTLGFPRNGMEKGGTEEIGNGVQRG